MLITNKNPMIGKTGINCYSLDSQVYKVKKKGVATKSVNMLRSYDATNRHVNLITLLQFFPRRQNQTLYCIFNAMVEKLYKAVICNLSQ